MDEAINKVCNKKHCKRCGTHLDPRYYEECVTLCYDCKEIKEYTSESGDYDPAFPSR